MRCSWAISSRPRPGRLRPSAGCNRFLDRVWGLSEKLVEGEGYRPALETLMHQTIKKVGSDIEGLKMNTAIAQLMTLVNALYDNGGATRAEYETLVQLLNPFAPHMTEELWEKLGHSHTQQLAYYPWPSYDEAKCVEATVEIAVQVNGKVKARLTVPRRHHGGGRHRRRQGRARRGRRPGGQDPGQGDLRQGPPWSTWPPRAEASGRGFHELFRKWDGKTSAKRLTGKAKMRYTVSVSYHVTTKFPPHGPREG